jgi:hypothetical protein
MAFDSGRLEFYDRSTRTRKATIAIIIVALGILLISSMTKDATSIVYVYMGIVVVVILVALIAFVRAFRVGITVDDVGVTAKTTWSTKRFRWDEISEAEAHDRSVVVTGRALVPTRRGATQRVEVLPILTMANTGRRLRIHGLKATISSSYARNWLDDAIHEINDRLQERRASGMAD